MPVVLLLPDAKLIDIAVLMDAFSMNVPVPLPPAVEGDLIGREWTTSSVECIRAQFSSDGARQSLESSWPDAVGRTVYVKRSHYHEFVL